MIKHILAIVIGAIVIIGAIGIFGILGTLLAVDFPTLLALIFFLTLGVWASWFIGASIIGVYIDWKDERFWNSYKAKAKKGKYL